jgi:6-phosphogluconolactonase
MTEIIYNADKYELNRLTLGIIQDSINTILETKSHVNLAIPGGQSVLGIYKLFKDSEIPWDNVHIFMVDERLVHIGHSDSIFKSANDVFIDHLTSTGKIPKKNVHPFYCNVTVPDYGTANYEAQLRELDGSFDIVLVSAGEDGHIAALFPNHPSVIEESQYFLAITNAPRPPVDRVTSTKNLILRSKVGIVLFYDEIKRDAFNMFLDENIAYNKCPAKLISELDKSYVVTNLE